MIRNSTERSYNQGYEEKAPFSQAQFEAADRCREALKVEPGTPCPINVLGRLCPKFCRCRQA